jgi:hypothetical protein
MGDMILCRVVPQDVTGRKIRESMVPSKGNHERRIRGPALMAAPSIRVDNLEFLQGGNLIRLLRLALRSEFQSKVRSVPSSH